MKREIVIVLFLPFFASVWRAGFATKNIKDELSFETIQDQLVEDVDGDLADREREDKVRSKNKLDFNEDSDHDDDIFFLEDDDTIDQTNRAKLDSVDWSWVTEEKAFKTHDAAEDKEEESVLKKLLQKIKDMLHKVGKRQ